VPKLPSRFYQACCRTPHKRKLGKSTEAKLGTWSKPVTVSISKLLQFFENGPRSKMTVPELLVVAVSI
jgi:hypothetical protein